MYNGHTESVRLMLIPPLHRYSLLYLPSTATSGFMVEGKPASIISVVMTSLLSNSFYPKAFTPGMPSRVHHASFNAASYTHQPQGRSSGKLTESRSQQQLELAKALLELPQPRSPAKGISFHTPSPKPSPKSRSPGVRKKLSSASPGERDGFYPCNRCGRYVVCVCVRVVCVCMCACVRVWCVCVCVWKVCVCECMVCVCVCECVCVCVEGVCVCVWLISYIDSYV